MFEIKLAAQGVKNVQFRLYIHNLPENTFRFVLNVVMHSNSDQYLCRNLSGFIL